MKVSDLFPSKYLRASDIPAGREVTVVIGYLEMVPIEEKEELRPCLFFQGHKKGLVLNRTNADTIAQSYGDDADLWSGKPVIIFVSRTLFRGQMVPCIRLRVPSPERLPSPPAPPPDARAAVNGDDIPF